MLRWLLLTKGMLGGTVALICMMMACWSYIGGAELGAWLWGFGAWPLTWLVEAAADRLALRLGLARGDHDPCGPPWWTWPPPI